MNRAVAPLGGVGDDKFCLDLHELSNEQIATRLEETLKDIYLKVAEAGFLLLELERRGYDTMKLRRRPIVKAVRDVAVGVLAQEAFAAFYGRTDILRCLTALPKERQIELVEVGTVEVYDKTGGQDTHRLIEIAELCPEEVRLVFDVNNHRVRKVEEQQAFLRHKGIREIAVTPTFSYDDRSGLLSCKNASPAQIRDYMKMNGL